MIENGKVLNTLKPYPSFKVQEINSIHIPGKPFFADSVFGNNLRIGLVFADNLHDSRLVVVRVQNLIQSNQKINSYRKIT